MMLPPNNLSIKAIAQSEGISEAMLYLWRDQARRQGQSLPNSGSTPVRWSSQDKFNIVLETFKLNEHELG